MDFGVINPKLSRIMFWLLNYIWILPFCMGAMITVVESDPLTRINWHQTNPLFNKTNGAKMSISVGSNLVILCPYLVSEYYTIYWVTEQEFTTCLRLPNMSRELLVNCSDPNSRVAFTQEVLLFTPVPNGKDFIVGNHYYITTFSTGTQRGLKNEYHGACDTWNMKLNLTIIDPPPLSTAAPSNGTKSTTPKPNNTPTPRPTKTTTKSTTTTTVKTSTHKPTPPRTTSRPRSTDDIDIVVGRKHVYNSNIPDPTDIVINVPDNGNTATIIANSAISLTQSWLLILSLSILYLLNSAHTVMVTR